MIILLCHGIKLLYILVLVFLHLSVGIWLSEGHLDSKEALSFADEHHHLDEMKKHYIIS